MEKFRYRATFFCDFFFFLIFFLFFPSSYQFVVAHRQFNDLKVVVVVDSPLFSRRHQNVDKNVRMNFDCSHTVNK